MHLDCGRRYTIEPFSLVLEKLVKERLHALPAPAAQSILTSSKAGECSESFGARAVLVYGFSFW